jgi:hypothetical protein
LSRKLLGGTAITEASAPRDAMQTTMKCRTGFTTRSRKTRPIVSVALLRAEADAGHALS